MIAAARWRALGTDAHLVVAEGDLDAARAAVEPVLDAIDRTLSRFRADSELTAVNAAAGRSVHVTPLFARALGMALRAARLSEGLVDPTIGRAVRLLGYDDDFERLPARQGGAPVLRLEAVPGWESISFDEHARTVRVPHGVELDFGSTGKALASDLAAAAACGAAGPASGVLVSLGGDIATGGTAPEGGWRVLAAESSATPADADGEVVIIRDGAVATSSTTVRRWMRGSVEVHHLVDPRTGGPAEGPWRTVSVVAGTCMDANIAATAAIIRGAGALDWLAGTGLAARLVSVDGSVTRIGGWPEPVTGLPEPILAAREPVPEQPVVPARRSVPPLAWPTAPAGPRRAPSPPGPFRYPAHHPHPDAPSRNRGS